MSAGERDKIKGLFVLIDRLDMKGLSRWVDELKKRKIPAVISINQPTVDNHPQLVKRLSDDGFEIAGFYRESSFWNESYDFQREKMSRLVDKISNCIGKPLRVFHVKYFGYTEDTLKIADDLGISFIFARGTAGARAVVYKPEEYRCRIISVSNVPSKAMGTGSLCDESLRCRTEAPDTLREILFNWQEDAMVLVAQTHVSGVKLHWWQVYQDFFDADLISWQDLDTFAAQPNVLPNAQIPLNTRADYEVPKPLVPLEEEEEIPSVV